MRKHLALASLTMIGCAVSAPQDSELDSTSQALQTVLVESEGSTGAGIDEAFAGASGGLVRRLDNAYTSFDKSFTITGNLQSLSVRARRSAGTCSPMFSMYIDGVLIGSHVITSSSFADFNANAVTGIGTHALRLYYRSGTAGCSVQFDRTTLTTADAPPPPPPPTPPLVLEAENATGQGVVEVDATASAGARRKFTASYQAATQAFTTTAPVVSGSVRVKTVAGCSAIYRVKIDSTVVAGGTVTATSWTTFSFGNLGIPAGNHVIEYYYRYGNCDLHYDQATLNFQ
jgi:hypothetical protein